ncbi:hypothetical protein QL093DRAFT_2370964 [Fusarium oxysporum]|nr:hypothetical protein QL093DRAFT_2370964 [Fusarium oxysporum]
MNTDELLRVWWQGCAIFSTITAEVSSVHCCLILKPAARRKAMIHFASRFAYCYRRAEVASCKLAGLGPGCRMFEGGPSVGLAKRLFSVLAALWILALWITM